MAVLVVFRVQESGLRAFDEAYNTESAMMQLNLEHAKLNGVPLVVHARAGGPTNRDIPVVKYVGQGANVWIDVSSLLHEVRIHHWPVVRLNQVSYFERSVRG